MNEIYISERQFYKFSLNSRKEPKNFLARGSDESHARRAATGVTGCDSLFQRDGIPRRAALGAPSWVVEPAKSGQQKGSRGAEPNKNFTFWSNSNLNFM